MINAVAKRTFLLKQEELPNGKKKDVLANRGERITLSEKDAIKFYGGLQFTDKDAKMLGAMANKPNNKVYRVI